MTVMMMSDCGDGEWLQVVILNKCSGGDSSGDSSAEIVGTQ